MDVISYLLSFVAKNRVFAVINIAFYEETKKSMKFYARMRWSGKASTPKAASRHIEIASVFLHHYVGSHLGRSEQLMLALIDGKRFGNTVGIGWVGVFPSRMELFHLD